MLKTCSDGAVVGYLAMTTRVVLFSIFEYLEPTNATRKIISILGVFSAGRYRSAKRKTREFADVYTMNHVKFCVDIIAAIIKAKLKSY